MSKSHTLSHEQEAVDFGFSFNLLGGCRGAPFFPHVLLECHGRAWRVFLAAIETVLLYILYCTHS